METENRVLDESGQRQVIEEVGEVLPDVGSSVFTKALVIEAINLGDLSTLVVATEDSNSVLVANLQGDQKRNGLDRVVATIDVIAHEKIVGVRAVASNSEQLNEVMELTVDVSANSDGATNELNVGFLDQNLPCFVAQLLDLSLRQRLALHQGLNKLVNIPSHFVIFLCRVTDWLMIIIF